MKGKILFLLVVVLAFLLRFYQLGKVPISLNIDEVVIGYDAYSIINTARDQYGKFLPIVFRSHDDYKPPVLIYLVAPSVAFFGLTDFAVRFPSASLGTLAVILVYLVSKRLFYQKQPLKVALIAALLLAISPWHLQFTRTAFEVGMQSFFTLAGLLFFLKAIDEKRLKWQILFFVVTGIFFGLSLHLYHASKVFIPLFLGVLSLLYFPQLKKNPKRTLVLFTTFAIFLIPAVLLFASPAGRLRFTGTSIFQDVRPHDLNLAWQISDWLRNDWLSVLFFHPTFLEYSWQILNNYFSHLSFNFLFLGQMHPSTDYVPRVGLLYLWELPFLFAGFYHLFRNPDRRPFFILLAWVILGPLPASVTNFLPSSIRAAILLPSFQLVTAYGIVHSYRVLPKIIKFVLPLINAVVLIYFLAYFLHVYLNHAGLDNHKLWYPGYRDIALKTASLAADYKQVIVSTSLDQPQGFFLYYLKYDPKRYLAVEGGTVSGYFGETKNHFDKYYFHPFKWNLANAQPDTLYVGHSEEFPSDAPFLAKFYFPNGVPAAYIVGRVKSD